MNDPLSREHRLRRRAERVRTTLEALWGDDLPDTPDPVTTVLVDAVAVDDQLGVDDGLVVQGDGLTDAHLARVLAEVRSAATLEQLPPRLRARLAGLLPPPAPVVDLRSTGGDALPGESSGVWEYDLATGTLCWDARAAAVWGLAGGAGAAPLAEWLRRSVHADDRSALRGVLDAAVATGQPCGARFRVLPPGRAAVLARGRVLTVPGAGVRVLGFTAPDDSVVRSGS
ncbi:hypothetical protein GTR02_16795 [Kineococcus sp. R8]|uniref:hypothetical protein n=1 Tax=Kineococcus siccus TaxID=2696567 RepID=UPI001412A53D|nr:hypothetical protein [Kineococcus siccus]NAZ83476.1 hypothetical protein [Kineococcus siccus]